MPADLVFLAWEKLTSEVQRLDQDLRILVGHASLLDSLTLAEAEKQQEIWFHKTTKVAERSWTDVAVEELQRGWRASDGSTDLDACRFSGHVYQLRIPGQIVRRVRRKVVHYTS